MADAEKRARAHFVVDTSRGLGPARAQVAEIIAAVRDPRFKPSPGEGGRDRAPG
jgi:dephospho-CoA kinase